MTLLHQVFDTMIEQLGEAVPDLGRATAGDASLSTIGLRCAHVMLLSRVVVSPIGSQAQGLQPLGFEGVLFCFMSIVQTIKWGTIPSCRAR